MQLTPGQASKLKAAIRKGEGTTLQFSAQQLSTSPTAASFPLSLTATQINQMQKAQKKGVGVQVKFSKSQMDHMHKSGGILPLLAAVPGILAAAAPAIAKTVALGALSGAAATGASRLIQASKKGKGLRLAPKKKGKGLFLARR